MDIEGSDHRGRVPVSQLGLLDWLLPLELLAVRGTDLVVESPIGKNPLPLVQRGAGFIMNGQLKQIHALVSS